jgi:hypothetical protein
VAAVPRGVVPCPWRVRESLSIDGDPDLAFSAESRGKKIKKFQKSNVVHLFWFYF